MRIIVRAGHNEISRGASALIDEVVEDRKVKNSLVKYLRELGHEVLDVTPGGMNADSDLVYGVSNGNNWGGDLFVSIHFNKAFNSYNGALGTESLVYSKSDNITIDEQVASRINSALVGLGFKNRGVKERPELYELRATKMGSIIVEVCFVEATEDVALYKKIGYDTIGRVIAEAIANKKLVVQKEEKKKVKGIVIYSSDIDKRGAEYLSEALGIPVINSAVQFDYTTVEQSGIYAVGGRKESYTSYLLDSNFITGSDRYETIKNVLRKIGKL